MAESLLDTTYSLFKTLEDNNSGYARWVRCSATLRTCASDIVTEADIASKFESIALESVSEGHKNLVTFDQFLNAHLFLTGVKIEGSTVFDHLQQTSQIVEECSSLKDELLEMAEKEVQLQKDLVFAKEENQRLQDDLYTRQKDFQNVLQLAHQREDEGVRSIGDESMFDIGNSILDDTLLNDMMHRDRERRAADGNASVNSTDMSPFKLALATSLGTRRQPSNADMITQLQEELAQAQALNASYASATPSTTHDAETAELQRKLELAAASNTELVANNAALQREADQLQQDLDAARKQLSAVLPSAPTSREQSPTRGGAESPESGWGAVKSSFTGGGIFRKKLERAKVTIAELEAQLRERDGELQHVREEAKVAEQLLTDDVRSLRQDIKDLKEEVATSQTIIERHKATIRKRDAELLDKETAEEEVQRLTQEVRVWRQRAHSHADASHSMATELDETTTGLHTAGVDLGKLESEVSQAYTDADELRTKLHEAESELSTSQLHEMHAVLELDTSQRACAQLEQKEIALREAFEQQKHELATVREQLLQKSVQVAALQGDVVAKTTTLTAERITVSSLQAELAQKTAVIEGLSKYLEELETQSDTQDATRERVLDATTRSVLAQLNDELSAARATIAELQQTTAVVSTAPSEPSDGRSLAATPHSMRGGASDMFNDTSAYADQSSHMRLARGGSDEVDAYVRHAGDAPPDAQMPPAAEVRTTQPTYDNGTRAPTDVHPAAPWEYDATRHDPPAQHPAHRPYDAPAHEDPGHSADAYLAKERESMARIIAELQATHARDADAAEALAADNAELRAQVAEMHAYIRTQNKELAVYKAERVSAARDGTAPVALTAYGAPPAHANDVYNAAVQAHQTPVATTPWPPPPAHEAGPLPARPPGKPRHGRVVSSELYAHEHANTEHELRKKNKIKGKPSSGRDTRKLARETTGIPGVSKTTAMTLQKLSSLGGQHIGFWPVEVLTAAQSATDNTPGGLKCYASVSTSGVALLNMRDLHVIAEWPFNTITMFGRERGVVSLEITDKKLRQRTFFFGTVAVAASELFDALQYGNDLN
eukprot:m.1032691 g.1032691  ORF g.1032691 m.1032691 type:complete len:1068 (-) comp24124_c0_seq2:75-3278(-)